MSGEHVTRNGDVHLIGAEGDADLYKVVGMTPASTEKDTFGERTFTLRLIGTMLLFQTTGRQVTDQSVLTPYTNPY